jgi:phage portal protein BeeE
MIGDTSKQTFGNFEQAGLNFLALAMMPWVVRIEQEVNRKLLNRVAVGRASPTSKSTRRQSCVPIWRRNTAHSPSVVSGVG